MNSKDKIQTSRRRFLEGTGAALVAAAAPAIEAQNRSAQAPGDASSAAAALPSVPRSAIRLTVNGKSQRIEVEDR